MVHKGLDDLLAAGGKPRRLEGDEVASFFTSVRAKLFSSPSAVATMPSTTVRPVAEPSADRPSFPVDVFPASVAQFVRSVAAATQCPVDFPGLAALVIAGAAIGAARALLVKPAWIEKPGLYAAIVSRPGTTKTPALKAVMRPIYDEQDRLYEQYKAKLKTYKKDLANYKRALSKLEEGSPEPEPPTEPILRHLFASDTTVEGLGAILEENRKGILLFRDELTAWVLSLNQYKGRGTDRQSFLSAWSGETVKIDRKSAQGKPLIIPHPFISVLGGIQPDLLTELEAEGGKEDGLLYRILFAYPAEGPVGKWTDAALAEDDAEVWRKTLGRLLILQPLKRPDSSERPQQLEFSPEGKQVFVQWFDRLADEMNGDDFPRVLDGPWKKLRSHCARFALILHLLRVACNEAGDDQSEGQVDAEDVARAVKLCDYFEAHFRLVFNRLRQNRQDAQVENLMKWMAKKALRRVTVREICRSEVCGIRKASDAEQLLKAAIDYGLGAAEWTDKRGPDRTRGPRIDAFVLNA
jgi:hypothetical protein